MIKRIAPPTHHFVSCPFLLFIDRVHSLLVDCVSALGTLRSHPSSLTKTCGQAVLAKRIASTAASVYASIRPLPSELNPILRPLVSAVKKEPDMQRRGRT